MRNPSGRDFFLHSARGSDTGSPSHSLLERPPGARPPGGARGGGDAPSSGPEATLPGVRYLGWEMFPRCTLVVVGICDASRPPCLKAAEMATIFGTGTPRSPALLPIGGN